MNYLLDTCVICEIRKPRPNKNVLAWLRSTDEIFLYTPVIVIGEIKKGIVRLKGSRRAKELQAWLDAYRTRYGSRIVPFDLESALEWGRIVAETEALGKPRPPIDAQIAAMAIAHGMTLATRNTHDMSFTGVKLFDPFEET